MKQVQWRKPHDYVYHLNVHNVDANCLKAILDYDLEDENHANVLVKHCVVKNVQSHKTNVQTLLNGFIILPPVHRYTPSHTINGKTIG